MIKIFKYELTNRKTELKLPIGAEILTASIENDRFVLWAKIDTSAYTEIRHFDVIFTGEEIPYIMGVEHKYMTTAYIDSGLVLHLFEVIG